MGRHPMAQVRAGPARACLIRAAREGVRHRPLQAGRRRPPRRRPGPATRSRAGARRRPRRRGQPARCADPQRRVQAVPAPPHAADPRQRRRRGRDRRRDRGVPVQGRRRGVRPHRTRRRRRSPSSIALDESEIALKPATSSMAEAAAIPLVGLTAWQALVEIAERRSPVSGSSSRPGQAASARSPSSSPSTSAPPSPRRRAPPTESSSSDLGADVVVDYRHDDVTTVLDGYDVALHNQDGKALRRCLPTCCGPAAGSSRCPDRPTRRSPTASAHRGSSARCSTRSVHPPCCEHADTTSTTGSCTSAPTAPSSPSSPRLVDDGAIRPVIDRTFPFAATGDALAAVESGRSRGKVVVTMR